VMRVRLEEKDGEWIAQLASAPAPVVRFGEDGRVAGVARWPTREAALAELEEWWGLEPEVVSEADPAPAAEPKKRRR
jgi:hypothetical protein